MNLTTTTSKDYFEQDIYIESIGVLKYSLSNNIETIRNAVFTRTGKKDINFIDTYGWQLNFNLSENVKKAMNKLNVNYSMTFYTDGNYQVLIINKRSGSNWYIVVYEEELRRKAQRCENIIAFEEVVKSNPKSKSNVFGTAFLGGLAGSLTGSLLKSIMKAGEIKPNKKGE
jgi:hypothetical protein